MGAKNFTVSILRASWLATTAPRRRALGRSRGLARSWSGCLGPPTPSSSTPSWAIPRPANSRDSSPQRWTRSDTRSGRLGICMTSSVSGRIRSMTRPCIPQYFAQLHGYSEKALLLASAELRQRTPPPASRITAKHLADFLAKATTHEALLLQRLHDHEARRVLETIAGNPTPVEEGAG